MTTVGRKNSSSTFVSVPERTANPATGGEREETPSFVSRLTRRHLLTAEQEQCLIHRVKRGDQRARERLIEANLRLVVSIAKMYRSANIPFEDLIQEGTIGLMVAAERFDPGRGFRFSTYATQWIRQAIGRAVENKGKSIRVPAHIAELSRKLDRARMEMQRENGEEPSTEQLALRTGIPLRKVIALLCMVQEPVSLDTPVGDEENTSLGNLLFDKASPDPQDALVFRELRVEIEEILETLDERERIVMRKRYGFDGEEICILQEIGEAMNLSRERVRQIEAQALRKLRSAARKRQLREYLSN